MTSLQEFKDLCLQHGIEQSKVDAFFTTVEKNLKDKRYGLVWEEQMESVAEELKKKFPVLKEVTEREIRLDKEGKTNVLIEGDNLESLTFLKNSGQKVDVIYIDPPYNTGNKDFVYNDRFVEKEYSWRHSSWLSFMDKRLKLARELLTEDGVIFISIDDNEMAQLKLLCDQIFGELNVETMIWNKVGDGDAGAGKMKVTHRFRREHEYILTVYKDRSSVHFKKYLEKPNYKGSYKNLDNDYRGAFKAGNMSKTEEKSSPTGKNYYTVFSPDGIKSYSRQWHVSEDEFTRLSEDNRIYWGKSGNGVPQIKIFLDEPKPTTPVSILTNKGSATVGSKLVKKDMGLYFDNPKPCELIKYLINLISKSDTIVLDFFAGSGTTGHAVLELNQEDGGNRQFILCTNNENNIAEEVTYERLKRVMNGYTTPKGKDVEGIPSNLKYFKVENIDTSVDRMTLEDTIVENIVPFVQFKENLWNTTVDDENNLVYLEDKVTIYTSNYEEPSEEVLENLIVGEKLYILEDWVDYFDSEILRKYQIVPIPKEFFNIKQEVLVNC